MAVSTLNDKLRDVLERGAWTAGEQFVAVLFAGSTATVVGLPWAHAGWSAVAAGLVSAVAVIQFAFPKTVDIFWLDLSVRVAKTFLASLAGTAIAAGFSDTVEWDIATALNIAAVATMAVLAKGLLARRPAGTSIAAGDNASTCPPDVYRKALTGNNSSRVASNASTTA